MDRSEALMHLCNHLQGWEDRENTPAGWYFCGDGCLRTLSYECEPITKADWMGEIRRHQEKPPIGLKPRKLHDEERIKAICEAVIRYASNGQLPDKEWIDELADLIEGLHDKIGDDNE